MSALTPFQQACVELLNGLPRTHATHCFRSALRHLDLARSLKEADPAMAMFRAITAEEEAASGAMRCLQELNYPEADRLKPKDHVFKHAIYPFMEVIELFFGQTFAAQTPSYRLYLQDTESGARLALGFPVAVGGQDYMASPVPPLNFGVSNPDSSAPIDYSYQISQLVAARGKDSIKHFLRDEANLRNRLLYASSTGIPVVESVEDGFFTRRTARALALLYFYLLVVPYAETQPFVAQALKVFVELMEGLRK